METISREQVQEFLRKHGSKLRKITKHKVTFRYHTANVDGTLTYSEMVDGEERGRVRVGLNAKDEPHIISEYAIGPIKSGVTTWPSQSKTTAIVRR